VGVIYLAEVGFSNFLNASLSALSSYLVADI